MIVTVHLAVTRPRSPCGAASGSRAAGSRSPCGAASGSRAAGSGVRCTNVTAPSVYTPRIFITPITAIYTLIDICR